MPQSEKARTKTHILISSLLSSTMSTLITNPIEVAKLKLQYGVVKYPFYQQQTFWGFMRTTFLQDGFRGLSVALPQVVLNNVLYMQLYEGQRAILSTYMNQSGATFLSAMLSRSIVATVLVPMEALRVRISNEVTDSQRAKNQRGLRITLTRDIIYSGMFWFSIEEIRNFFIGHDYRTSKLHSQQVPLLPNVLAGLIAGSVVSAVTTPFDVLKTRTQSGVITRGKITQQLTELYRTQGSIGLFAGIQFRVMKSGLHSAMYLIFYETLLGKLAKNNLL